ncbi:MAG: DUF3617 family protein [Terracidiphilus sp.]
MRFPRSFAVAAVSVLALTIFVWAQTRKAGLWKTTSTMTWEQSPFPGGMDAMGAPRTTEVCVTQEQIDKYGTVPPQTRGDCQVTNLNKTDHGMSAVIECSGRMQGKGTVEASWTDDTHSTSKVHFVGVMQMGPNSKPFEWSIESSSVFESTDCGSVKPIKTE